MINGSLLEAYLVCKRQAWFLGHAMAGDREHRDLAIGRFLSDETYPRQKHEILLGDVKIDLLRKEDGLLCIGEIKKSSNTLSSARFQLLLYLFHLEQAGISAQGELLVPLEKHKEIVTLTEEDRNQLLQLIEEIEVFLASPKAPTPSWFSACSRCSYAELCWA